MSPAEVAREAETVLAARARTFRYAAALLPSGAFRDAAIVYAVCRLVDDLADEPEHRQHGHVPLDRLRAELLGFSPPRPIVAAFLEVEDRRGGLVSPMIELLEGCRSDLMFRPIRTDAALIEYAYRVAGTVGLMMCAVLDVRDPSARAFAVDLGVAMQITNICRDVAEDAGNGRVYLPAERLEAAGLSTADVLSGGAGVGSVVLSLLDLADRYYDSAARGYRFLPLRVRPAIAVAARVYRSIGGVLRAWHGDVWRGRAVVGGLRRAWASCLGFVDVLMTSGASAPHETALHAPLSGRFGVQFVRKPNTTSVPTGAASCPTG